ncbi:MAG: hypothetical protein V3S40_08420 [Kiloniellales bacterium]|jgi:hypothetical protein
MSMTDLDTILFHLKRALGNNPAAQEEVQRAVAGLEQRLRDIESRLRALEQIPDSEASDAGSKSG